MWKQNKEKLGVMGHRGCCGYMPENTLISFREAFRLGVDFLEFDVHKTLDGHLVVIHDSMVNRTTDGIGAVNFMTLEEIKALDAGVKFGYPGEKIPTLDETLKCIKNEAPKHMYLDVEIKDQIPEVIDKTIEALDKFELLEKTVIDSFDAQTLLYIQKYYPNVKTHAQPPILMDRFDKRVLDKVCALAVPLRFSDEEVKNLVDLADSYGIEAWGYIADTKESVERALKFGFTNLTANDPHAVIDYLDKIDRRSDR